MNERPQPHAGRPERYGEFYDEDAQEVAAWLNGAEWARSPEEIEAAHEEEK